jgi:hypothetical protein
MRARPQFTQLITSTLWTDTDCIGATAKPPRLQAGAMCAEMWVGGGGNGGAENEETLKKNEEMKISSYTVKMKKK